MQVIGKDYRGDDFERPISPYGTKRAAQVLDVFHQQRTIPLLQVHGKEIGSTGNPDATVIGHDRSMAISSPERSRQMTSGRVGKIL
jgi:hypothetical protein